MKYVLDVPDFQPESGLSFKWENGFEIGLTHIGSEVRITGNAAGLVSLARHLLTLSQDLVREGSHIHLTAGEEVESDLDLVLEKLSDQVDWTR